MYLTAYGQVVACMVKVSRDMRSLASIKTLLVMKLTAILMLVSCMHVAASGFGQQITLAGKDMTLRQIFDEIRKQSGYTFFYFDKDLTNAKNVTLQVKNEELRDVLNIVFQDQFLTYTIINKSIIVKQKGSESNQETPIPSPPIDVRGRIINENGEPLAGITVTVKGTQKATASNDNGFFEMKDVEDNATLVFTGVNVETYEIPIKGRADLATVNLRSKVNPLSEINVTVNTGYQTIAKDRAAGSIAKPDLKVMLGLWYLQALWEG